MRSSALVAIGSRLHRLEGLLAGGQGRRAQTENNVQKGDPSFGAQGIKGGAA